MTSKTRKKNKLYMEPKPINHTLDDLLSHNLVHKDREHNATGKEKQKQDKRETNYQSKRGKGILKIRTTRDKKQDQELHQLCVQILNFFKSP